MMDFILYKENSAITNERAFRKFIKEIPDGKHLVKIENRNKRTLSQNGYYFAILPFIKDALHDIGYNEIRDKDDVHILLRQMFLKRRIVNENTGEIIGELSRSTTDLTVKEFGEYLDRITQWCAEYLLMDLPQPNSQLKAL